MERYIGSVRWFSNPRGYGFVQIDGDPKAKDYFVHYSHVDMEGYKTLTEGQKVSFTLVESERGIQAREVRPE
jgi:CspA family cold shock protein